LTTPTISSGVTHALGAEGYEDRWVVFRIGSVATFVIHNSKQPIRSVRLQEIHHVLTDSHTSWTGEAKIGACVLASPCYLACSGNA
jgi:hypothetical protein